MPSDWPGTRRRDIIGRLAEQINRGELPPGTRLPTERALAAEMGVNRSTVALAYAELAATGLVERRQGSGTTVRGDLWGVAPDWPRYLQGGAFEPERPLRELVAAARRAPGTIDLAGSTIGRDLAPRAALEALLRDLCLPDSLDYPDPRGDRRLRAILAAQHADRHGVAVDPEQVLVTGGGQQAVDLLIRGLLGPGDAVALEQPSYYYSLPLFQSAGLRLLPLPVDELGLDPGALPALAQRHPVRLVLVNATYQNPTGTTLTLARREALLTTCRALNIPLVEEDGYGRLTLDGTPPPSLHALDREGRVLALGTLSKDVAPALRLGWLIGPRPVIDRLAEIKRQIDFGTNAITQALVADFLGSPAWPAHLAAVRAALRQRRDWLVGALAGPRGPALRLRAPAGGLHLWARWPTPGDDRARLAEAARVGVAYLPGRLYGAPDGWLRLTYADLTGEAEAVEAARRLGLLA